MPLSFLRVLLSKRGNRDYTHLRPQVFFVTNDSLCSVECLLRRKACKIVTCLYMDCSSARFIFIQLHFLIYETVTPLAATRAPSRVICSWGSENCLTWRILSSPSSSARERIQALSQLNGVLSDAGHVIVNCIMVGVSFTVWYNATMVRCRRTNVEDDLSWGFNHFVNNKLGVVDISPRASSTVLDTYLDLGDKEMVSEPLEVVLLCFIGVDGLGE
jgi:hypothetical protein